MIFILLAGYSSKSSLNWIEVIVNLDQSIQMLHKHKIEESLQFWEIAKEQRRGAQFHKQQTARNLFFY